MPDFLDDADFVLEIEVSDLLVLVGIEREIADVEVEDIEGVLIWGLGEGSK